MAKIALNNILENIFHIGEMNSKEEIEALLAELDKLPPDTVIIDAKKLEEQLGKKLK